MAQVKNQSEHMFVEWAQGIQAENYDVQRVAELLNNLGKENLLGLDIGGGIGRYAQLVCDQVPSCRIVVLDKSKLAEEVFVDDSRLEHKNADYFDYEPSHLYDFVIFKTVLHHFISDNETDTTELQRQALRKAHSLLRPGGLLFIEENFYQGVLGDDTPGRLIYTVTKQRWIENLVRRLGANTAGEGVRFRSISSWEQMLERERFSIRSLTHSPTWGRQWALWQRIPLLSSGRFQGVLEARATTQSGELRPARQPFSFGTLIGLDGSSAIMARVRDYWHNTSNKLRLGVAVIAVTGPIISTCALTEA